MRPIRDQRVTVLMMLLAALTVTLASTVRSPYRLIYNPSESAPRGWYGVGLSRDLKIGAFVLVRLPDDAARLADERRYLPRSVPLLKRVAAVSGQHVCERDGVVEIEGSPVARAKVTDGAGRRLHAWTGCRTLAGGELFLLSRTTASSFDSRYFGPIDHKRVIGRAIPVWTW
jgi:conjugative transfer signal peptidase TraF